MFCTPHDVPCYKLWVAWYILENSVLVTFHLPELTVEWEGETLQLFEQV